MIHPACRLVGVAVSTIRHHCQPAHPLLYCPQYFQGRRDYVWDVLRHTQPGQKFQATTRHGLVQQRLCGECNFEARLLLVSPSRNPFSFGGSYTIVSVLIEELITMDIHRRKGDPHLLPSITKPKSATAEYAHATDRFARKIAPILGVQLALAAADANVRASKPTLCVNRQGEAQLTVEVARNASLHSELWYNSSAKHCHAVVSTKG